MLTEANLEAHSYRLEFAQELLGSFAKARRAMSNHKTRSEARPEIEKASFPNSSINTSPELLTSRMTRFSVQLLP